MPRIVQVTTVPASLRFLAGQVGYMRDAGFEVTVLSSPGEELRAFGEANGVETMGVEMARSVTPVRDAATLARLTRVLRRLAPDIVHANTPKGGLLGTTAAAAARVPNRIYHIKGLPFETATGTMRHVLMNTERVSCAFAHRVLCVSAGIRDLAIAERIVGPNKIQVLGHGSSNGVDARERFNPAKVPKGTRNEVRKSLGIPQDAVVVGFVGRLVGDKGVNELAEAWEGISASLPKAHLLVVGPFEERDPVPEKTRRILRENSSVTLCDKMMDGMTSLYSAMDVLALPSYREGVPNVLLEAQAMGLAVVASTIPGCVEATREGESAILVPVRDAARLQEALEILLRDELMRARFGKVGREWVLRAFEPESIWRQTREVYEEMLAR
ncbi:MAG: glycosyltransferase involved in cell wall biosynthesis [Bradymonadia bacterium]|jgi:glycosyltransferase involved in cell wall biosynthesis